ncbi:leptin receptor gene-related protein [Condylostylus longicornis]|uniref:leptin receptor gene-related protein n=1 Tax=Condylostylus longicornis TaxID=2530218 RepID=UPI00244E3312|nr:leptin receptor gene-related protein [Condylostylus longicornis]
MTLIILACAVPQQKVFWPFFVVLFHMFSVIPIYLAIRRGSDSTGSAPNACYEFALFLTAGIVLSTFAFPIVLAKAGVIIPMASYLTIAGSLVIYITIFGHAMREVDEGYGGMF